MYHPFSGNERRRHEAFLLGATEIRIQRDAESALYKVSHAEQPMQWLEADQGELERLKARAMKTRTPVTTCQPFGEAGKGGYSETTRIAGRLDSSGTMRPSCQRVVERFGQRRLLSASYHWEGRLVSPAVVSGGADAFRRLGVLDSQALREHDEDTGVHDLRFDERPMFSRPTYSGADEVHIEALPGNNLYRRSGQPWHVSVSVSGGAKVAIGFATEIEVSELRGLLEQTMLVIRQDGRQASQKGWSVIQDLEGPVAAS